MLPVPLAASRLVCALSLLLAACASSGEVERARSDYALAEHCLDGDLAERPQMCRDACARGIAAGCRLLGRTLLEGDSPDYAAALVEYERGCGLGDAASCVDAGVLIAGDRAGRPMPRAMRHYRYACDMGDAAGCSNLGLVFQLGEVVPKDELRASQLYQRGCAGGDPGGCANLAFLLHYGLGVSRNDGRARQLYEEACEQGHRRACGNLAAMLLAGRGGEKDAPRALGIYRETCAAGELEACGNLAVLLESGTGIARTDEALIEARRLYTKACDGGVVDACLGLGRMYEVGGGGPVDLVQAGRLYRRACEATKDTEACDRYARVRKARGLDGTP